jgi:hypothetical protein
VAEAVSEGQPTQREEALVIARRRAEQAVPRHRFGLAYLGLAALLGAAVGLLVVLSVNGGKDSGPAWSAWKPTETGIKRLNEIATYVSHEYALPNGRTLAAVYSTPPIITQQGQAVPVRAIGVTTGLPGESAADARIYDASTAWAYLLCGLGKNCALPGQPSGARIDLLRREALELALYTFKYESAVDAVIAYMPPAAVVTTGTKVNTLFFVRRGEVKPALDAPLPQTLSPPRGSLRPGQMSPRDLSMVHGLTGSRIFRYAPGKLQDGSPILVLQPQR